MLFGMNRFGMNKFGRKKLSINGKVTMVIASAVLLFGCFDSNNSEPESAPIAEIVVAPATLIPKNDSEFLSQYEGIWQHSSADLGDVEAVITQEGIVSLFFETSSANAVFSNISPADEGYAGSMSVTSFDSDTNPPSVFNVSISPNPYELIVTIDDTQADDALAGKRLRLTRKPLDKKLYVEEVLGLSYRSDADDLVDTQVSIDDTGKVTIDVEGCPMRGKVEQHASIDGLLAVAIQPDQDDLTCKALNVGVNVEDTYALVKLSQNNEAELTINQGGEMFRLLVTTGGAQ